MNAMLRWVRAAITTISVAMVRGSSTVSAFFAGGTRRG
jgi:hypothetical protein